VDREAAGEGIHTTDFGFPHPGKKKWKKSDGWGI
jgi:hypothetical protein